MHVLGRRWTACLLAFSMYAVGVHGQAERAILYPGPNVSLNGEALQTSSAVTSGDRIKTGNGEAQLTGLGLLATIEHDTILQYGDVILLQCGGVVVSSSANAVQASDTRVTPAGGTAKFHMTHRHGKLAVRVESGTVRVSSDEVVSLSAGQSIERESSDGCPVPGAAIPANTAGAISAGHGKIAALAIAGGGGAVAVGIIVGRKHLSESRP